MSIVAAPEAKSKRRVNCEIGPVKSGQELHLGSGLPKSKKQPVFAPPDEYVREDWHDLRDLDSISRLAGVAKELLPKLAVKELFDNAADISQGSRFGLLKMDPGNEVTFVVHDYGPGIPGTDDDLAIRFSIRRPLTSSKIIRKVSRGMLGNGLRVVVGIVLVSGGQLRVSTRGRTLHLSPQHDGTTRIVSVEPWDGTGTRIEVTIRGELSRHCDDLFGWAEEARALAQGKEYKGKTSALWYTASAYWELLQSSGNRTIEAEVANFEGLSSRKKAEAAAGRFLGRAANSLTRDEAAELLAAMRDNSRPVDPDRLGKVGERDDYLGYAKQTGEYQSGEAVIPYVVEAWANRASTPRGVICVNRTPIVTRTTVQRVSDQPTDYAIFGAGLGHRFKVGMKRCGEYSLLINVLCPAPPLTSSGKEPNLKPMLHEIIEACEKAVRVAKRKAPKGSGKPASQKSLILKRLKQGTRELSGDGTTIFSLRQLFYFVRPFLIDVIGDEPAYGTFCRVIGEYEDRHGDIEGLYRDDRGSLFHPHTGEVISLGTRSVAAYERPTLLFRTIIYSEKEGFFPILQQAQFPERFDCALLTSKGFATRAARALVQQLQLSGEPITVLCIHDSDGPGTVIFENLKRVLEPYGIKVINLGLDPDEAREMELQDEPVKRKDGKSVPVGEYLTDEEKEWLQTHRIELNAMTTPQFLAWLERKIAPYAKKVIPPRKVISETVEAEARRTLTERITAEVLQAANITDRVNRAMEQLKPVLTAASKALGATLPDTLKTDPGKHWTDVVRSRVVDEIR